MNSVVIYPSQGSSNPNVGNSSVVSLDEIIDTIVADNLYNYIKSHDNKKVVLHTSHGEKISIRIESDYSFATFFSFLLLVVLLLLVVGFAFKDLNNKNK